MAARNRKSAPKHIEPDDEVQQSPEEEPAAVLESNGPVNQAELVRKAVAAGHEKPSTGVPYIKSKFGAEIDPKYYSVAKSQLKKREAKESPVSEPVKRGRKPHSVAPAAPKPLVEGYLAPPEKPKAAGEPDVLLALEGVKDLFDTYGADKIRRIVDLLS